MLLKWTELVKKKIINKNMKVIYYFYFFVKISIQQKIKLKH